MPFLTEESNRSTSCFTSTLPTFALSDTTHKGNPTTRTAPSSSSLFSVPSAPQPKTPPPIVPSTRSRPLLLVSEQEQNWLHQGSSDLFDDDVEEVDCEVESITAKSGCGNSSSSAFPNVAPARAEGPPTPSSSSSSSHVVPTITTTLAPAASNKQRQPSPARGIYPPRPTASTASFPVERHCDSNSAVPQSMNVYFVGDCSAPKQADAIHLGRNTNMNHNTAYYPPLPPPRSHSRDHDLSLPSSAYRMLSEVDERHAQQRTTLRLKLRSLVPPEAVAELQQLVQRMNQTTNRYDIAYRGGGVAEGVAWQLDTASSLDFTTTASTTFLTTQHSSPLPRYEPRDSDAAFRGMHSKKVARAAQEEEWGQERSCFRGGTNVKRPREEGDDRGDDRRADRRSCYTSSVSSDDRSQQHTIMEESDEVDAADGGGGAACVAEEDGQRTQHSSHNSSHHPHYDHEKKERTGFSSSSQGGVVSLYVYPSCRHPISAFRWFVAVPLLWRAPPPSSSPPPPSGAHSEEFGKHTSSSIPPPLCDGGLEGFSSRYAMSESDAWAIVRFMARDASATVAALSLAYDVFPWVAVRLEEAIRTLVDRCLLFRSPLSDSVSFVSQSSPHQHHLHPHASVVVSTMRSAELLLQLLTPLTMLRRVSIPISAMISHGVQQWLLHEIILDHNHRFVRQRDGGEPAMTILSSTTSSSSVAWSSLEESLLGGSLHEACYSFVHSPVVSGGLFRQLLSEEEFVALLQHLILMSRVSSGAGRLPPISVSEVEAIACRATFVTLCWLHWSRAGVTAPRVRSSLGRIVQYVAEVATPPVVEHVVLTGSFAENMAAAAAVGSLSSVSTVGQLLQRYIPSLLKGFHRRALRGGQRLRVPSSAAAPASSPSSSSHWESASPSCSPGLGCWGSFNHLNNTGESHHWSNHHTPNSYHSAVSQQSQQSQQQRQQQPQALQWPRRVPNSTPQQMLQHHNQASSSSSSLCQNLFATYVKACSI